MTATETLAKLPTTRTSGQPDSVRTQAVFGCAPCAIALPLNRKTTENALKTIPLDGLEPRQDFMPVKGLEAYLKRPRQDPADVAHVIMRDGRERWIVQEGHTRLGAAKLRGDESYRVRVWEFVQTETGDFEPVLRGYHRIKSGYRKKLISMMDDDIINLPDISDVSFPTLIGNNKGPRKKRKPVKYKGVKLSRLPMKFEAQVLSLTEIPPRLDLAVEHLQDLDRLPMTTLSDIAHFGAVQCLLELVRQGAPIEILASVPVCDVYPRATALLAERERHLSLARDEYIAKLKSRKISDHRRQTLVHELSDRRMPAVIKRTAKHAVNACFAMGRAAVIAKYRRRRVDLAYHDWETGEFVSKAEAIAQGHITIDAVIQTAVMDTNTCEECEDVDGEVMEFGDERQEELHPPYVKCLGGDQCRCVQIAILGDGTHIDVDEIDEDTIE